MDSDFVDFFRIDAGDPGVNAAIQSAGNDAATTVSTAVQAVTSPISSFFSNNEGWFIGGGVLIALLLVVVLIHEVDML